MTKTRRQPCTDRPQPHAQRGVVLLFSLIALLILLIAGVALIRSFNTSLFTAGNIAFKRDLVNQAERVVPVVFDQMKGIGALATPVQRSKTAPDRNYSARVLPTNAQGIPEALIDDKLFAAAGSAAPLVFEEPKIEIRYLIDRMCNDEGLDTTLGPAGCQLADGGAARGGSSSINPSSEDSAGGLAGAVPQSVVYRLSIRVTGPRNTQSFFQTTFAL